MRQGICTLLLFYLFLNILQAEDYITTANKYFNEGKLSLAEIFYKKALEQKPDDFEVNYNLGKIYYNNNDYVNAVKYLQTAYDIKPEREILFMMADSYVGQNNPQKGFSVYSNIMLQYPDYGDVYLNAGLVAYNYLYDKDLTITHWKKFLMLKPNDEQAPKIRKALEYLENPDFVLNPPSTKTNLGTALTGSPTALSNMNNLLQDIKGKDIKSESDEKYDLKKRKSITTE